MERLALYSASGFGETFLKAHLERLKPRFVLTGGPPPSEVNGRPLTGHGMAARLQRKWYRWRTGVHPNEVAFDRFLRNERPQAIFGEFGTSSAALVAACRRHAVPVFGSFYGYDAFEERVVERHAARYHELFGYARAILAQSHSIQRRLVALGCPAEKIIVNPCPPNPAFAAVERIPQPACFVATGRFVDKKSPMHLLLAFQRVQREVPEAQLLWAGDGHLWETTRELARILKLEGAVTFKGRITPGEQAGLLARAAVFVQHSVTAANGDQEGLPVAIMEAMLAGVPIVSTRHSGIPEVVEHGRSGLLVEERDVEGMAEAMIALARDPGRATAMGKAGKAFIAEHFTMDQHIAGIERMLSLAHSRPA